VRTAGSAAGVGCPVAELVSLVVAVAAASTLCGDGGAADAPAPGASVRDTSPFNGSAGA
jgi:hypothetical protein